jgi:general secretion pathway protein K
MPRRRDRGIALILALLILTILAILISQMTITSLHNRTTAENPLSDLKNSYGTRSGYHQAILYLATDLEKTPTVDTLHERWASPIDLQLADSRVRAEVMDSERFLNLSHLVNEKGETNAVLADRLRRLVLILRHPPETAERIIDYIDADTRGSFESNARNERLYNLEELLRVEDLSREALYGTVQDGEVRKGLLAFLTVWPRGSGKDEPTPVGAVNANTAPPEILAALSDKMTPVLAEAIVSHRNTPVDAVAGGFKDFQSVEEVRKVQGMTDEIFQEISKHLVVRSATFEVRARSVTGNVERAWNYVIRRSADKKRLTLLASQRMTDFPSARPPDEEPR